MSHPHVLEARKWKDEEGNTLKLCDNYGGLKTLPRNAMESGKAWRRRRTDGVAHCRLPLDSSSAPWQTRATHAAPPTRRAPARTTVSAWRCQDTLSLDILCSTAPVGWGDHQPVTVQV